jgi:hypothetical protein
MMFLIHLKIETGFKFPFVRNGDSRGREGSRIGLIESDLGRERESH